MAHNILIGIGKAHPSGRESSKGPEFRATQRHDSMKHRFCDLINSAIAAAGLSTFLQLCTYHGIDYRRNCVPLNLAPGIEFLSIPSVRPRNYFNRRARREKGERRKRSDDRSIFEEFVKKSEKRDDERASETEEENRSPPSAGGRTDGCSCLLFDGFAPQPPLVQGGPYMYTPCGACKSCFTYIKSKWSRNQSYRIAFFNSAAR